jgi:hypothetical protein
MKGDALDYEVHRIGHIETGSFVSSLSTNVPIEMRHPRHPARLTFARSDITRDAPTAFGDSIDPRFR